MSNHGNTERHIIDLFNKCNSFKFEGSTYKIELIGKPKPNKGECKTDVYILAKDVTTDETREIKISIKQSNADFLENKMSLERAIEIFGQDVKNILIQNIKLVEQSFLDDYLVYFNRFRKTEDKCIKMGWKFELINKHGGTRSEALLLNESQKINIYSGVNLSQSKRDAKVAGKQIVDSGIANYILVVDCIDQNLEYYLNKLQPINEYAIKQDLFFACKALNYRASKDKWDGNRPLSVFIDWKLDNGIIKANFVFDRPLEIKGNEIGVNIRAILKTLQIGPANFDELKKHLNKDIAVYI